MISLLSSFLISVAAADVPVPPLKARVTDQTATLAEPQRAALEAKLAAFEAKKGSQVAVLLVPSTSPETIEQYSIRVVDQWKLGRKGVDDGVLLLVAKNDRKLRIEVGRGLEGAIPDAIAKRIVAEIITPRFKQGDFYGGISAGVDRILGAIEGEPLPAPPAAPSQARGEQQVDWFMLVFAAIMIVPAAIGILNATLGRAGGAVASAGLLGAVVWLFTRIVIVGVLAGIVGFVLALFWRATSARHWNSGSGWSSGGWSSGGGGGVGGGGGFSGGGGGLQRRRLLGKLVKRQ